jgi:outer membrane protein assembly factor BamA
VYRFAAGLGIPYGNSKAMPFEKSFYAGGANGIRAWRARELGPGSLPDSSESNVDQIGNMSLEGNIELRFPITGIFEGPAFIDAGNIWNVSQEDSRPNTEFAFQNLWKGTAVGVGAGLRLNFTFFVMRLDIATPIKDPGSLDPYLIKSRWNRTNLNLGIGYPF